MLRQTWNPLIPGMSTSRSTRSGRSRSNSSRACLPSEARAMRKRALPSVLDARRRSVGSSSAIRTRGSGCILVRRRAGTGQNLGYAVVAARVLVFQLDEQAGARIRNITTERLCLDLAAQLGQRAGAHICAARLERVRGAAQEIGVGLVEGAPKLLAPQE